MSKLVNACENRKNFRRQLLATVSAIALFGSVYGTSDAKAADGDSDHPLVWIELGGQLSRLDEGQEAFSPHIMSGRPSVLSPSQELERLPLYSFDEEGKISFEPTSSNWIFSASVRYGRSGSDKHVRQQTTPKHFTKYFVGHLYDITPSGAKFAETNAQIRQSHAIMDFQAGKDVGLGMFGGKDGSSVFNLGVRFAQFSAKSNITLKSDPDWQFNYIHFGTLKFPFGGVYHSNAAAIRASRSFRGLGPSLSWNGSAPFAGNADQGEVALDWGINAAVLFGRQKAVAHHQSTVQYRPPAPSNYAHRYVLHQYVTDPPARSHTVTVPNVGGFAGLSFRYSAAKLSLGYRADLFWGAMDGGIDARKNENVGFYGPFASISVGIGG